MALNARTRYWLTGKLDEARSNEGSFLAAAAENTAAAQSYAAYAEHISGDLADDDAARAAEGLPPYVHDPQSTL